ncbi:MAG TPA: SRPBCC family protein [Dehalococcoidia bacterium]|jgi:hypothetical protein|nr:SRPBCC family protein [Dehalococcoidia bacterium]
MAVVDLQAVVAQPPDAVYRALCDLARRPELDPTIVTVENAAPDGAPHEGTTFRGAGMLPGTEERFDGLVTGLEPNRFAAFGYNYANGASLHEQWRLSPTPSGTLIKYHAELRLPSGVLGRLLDVLMVGPGFKRQREAMLAQAKAALDAEA